jgi:tellurite resistance protein
MAIPTSSIMVDPPVESSSSAMSWGPVIAGAFVSTVVTLILMLAGAGLGLTLVSPFPSESSSAATLSVYAAIWLVIVQWVSSGVGGYLAGRLRTKWVGVHTDEVFFRDTTHGFLSWAVATVVVAIFLGSTVSSIVSGTASTITQAAASTTAVAAENLPDLSTSYFTDALLRPADPRTAAPTTAAGSNEAAATELSRILMRSAANGELSTADRTYVEQLIAARTGLSEADAKARVDTVLKEIEDAKVAAQEAADTARKSAATTALLGALSLFIGAFIACAAAALGGRQRDDEEAIYLAS